MIGTNKFFTLIRYFNKRDYVELFMNGKIYMNYLGYFWDMLNVYPEQYDLHEGIVLTKNTKQFHIQGVLGEYLVSDPMFRAEGYKYCNVACFYRVDAAAFPVPNRNIMINWHEYSNMKEFGNFVVIINDADEFMRRIDKAMQREKFKYCAGDVRYYEEMRDGKPVPNVPCMVSQTDGSFDLRKMPGGQKFDSFDKIYKFHAQNEWRISLYRGVKEENAYMLDVGDLHDIIYLTDAEHMANDFNWLLSNNAIKPNWDYEYQGNATRDELRDLFIALGDYQAKLSLVLKKDILPQLPPPQPGDFLDRWKKKYRDVRENLSSGKITQEEFNAEKKRLHDILKRQHVKVFYEKKTESDK